MKKIEKRTIETVKTVVIAILITAVVAFVAGMRYADEQQLKVEAAVKSVVKTEPKESSKQ